MYFGLWIGREKENGKESIHERNTKMDFDVAVKTSRFTVQNFGIDMISFPTGVFVMFSSGVSRYKGWNVWFVQMYLYYWYRSCAMIPCDSDVPWLWLDILFSMTFGLGSWYR